MSFNLKVGEQGILLTLIETSDYDNWLTQQSGTLQNWLNSTGYKGEGLSLVPGEDGALSQVIYGVKSLKDQFVCGDLATKLPEGDYCIQGDESLLKAAAFSWGLGTYRFNRYKNSQENGFTISKNPPPKATLVLPSQAVVDEAERYLNAIVMVRDLVNTPAGDMMPENLGAAVEELGKTFGATVNQIVGDDLLAQNYPTIHAVGRASAHAPRLVDLRWGDEGHPKITLVGKGVCFDSGGLDIKPAAGMRRMKKDMGGSANVLGLASLIMSHNLPVRLRVLIPAVENAVSGNAYRPGDIVKTRKGITVEIDNTDAEGRLVLCDALAEASTENPELLIDMATLTGANTIALGAQLPGIYSRDIQLSRDVADLGTTIDDPLWPMPLFADYKDTLKSTVADVMNCGTAIPNAGNITAGLYLGLFVEENIPWLHIDFMAWNEWERPGRPIGGEALGIRALFAYLQNRFSA